MTRKRKERACRVCGCTWNRACPGGCWWVGPDLCSACEDPPKRACETVAVPGAVNPQTSILSRAGRAALDGIHATARTVQRAERKRHG